MKKRSLICSLWLIVSLSSCENQVDENLKYLGLKPPTTTPEVFAPGLISTTNEYEFGSVFNKDGTEFYYGVNVGGREEIRYCKQNEDGWSKPITLLSHERYGYNDPFLSPDEKRLYFISKRAMDGQGELKDYDIWYAERKGDGWSDPINAGPNINTEGEEYYISFNKEGTMYFSSNKIDSNFDIYSSAFVDGEFQPTVPLGDAINTSNYEADVFIDPDESYIIFCARRPDGLGQGDLYISFKQEDGTWTPSKNMGEPINTQGHELCPFVTMDGKYFLYTSNKDIYWVDAKIIEEMRE
ncbi:MAG: hypothetical protein KTR30_05070 [Saprospiraceae bacterium]|nr:hypothetical protein [Saprospiraceae bacterium]